jgi:hypothetical protein
MNMSSKQRIWALAPMLMIFLIAGSSKPPIFIRIHVEAPKGTPQNRVVPIALADGSSQQPEIIQVSKFAILSESNIKGAMRLPGGGALLTFDATGSNALEVATSQNIGRTLVVICNGRVAYAPMIDVALRKGKMFVPRGITDEEFAILEKYIAKKNKG